MKLPPCFPKGIKYGTFSDPSAYTIRRLRDQNYSVYLHSHFSYFKYFLKNIPVKFIHFLHHPKSLKLHILKVTMRMKSIIQTPYKHFYYQNKYFHDFCTLTKRIKFLTLSLYKTLLGETGCLGNPYFYLLVA